jgi:hypothetical protein
MHKWQKLILIVVVGLMLVAPWGMANLATPASVAAQPSAQVAYGIVVPDGLGCGDSQLLPLGNSLKGWMLCLPPQVPTTNVNWNS